MLQASRSSAYCYRGSYTHTGTSIWTMWVNRLVSCTACFKVLIYVGFYGCSFRGTGSSYGGEAVWRYENNGKQGSVLFVTFWIHSWGIAVLSWGYPQKRSMQGQVLSGQVRNLWRYAQVAWRRNSQRRIWKWITEWHSTIYDVIKWRSQYKGQGVATPMWGRWVGWSTSQQER